MNKEARIFGWLLSDRLLWVQMFAFLKSDYFTDPEIRSIVDFMLKYTEEHKAIPTAKILEAEFGFDPTEKYPAEKPTDVERDYISRELEKFYKNSRLNEFLLNSVDMLENDDVDYGRLESEMKDIVKASLKVDIGMNYFRDVLERLEEIDRPLHKVSTGFSELDRMMGGGWEPSELHLIAGGTGAGKSIFLANFSANNTIRGRNVLMITLELSEPVFGLRYDQIFTERTRDRLLVDKQKTAVVVNKIQEACGGDLTIKFYPTSSLTTNMLEAYLEFYYLEKGFYPDIIYVDYLSLMRPNMRMKDMSTYAMEKYISEELRGLAGQLNIPIISASQLNRAGIESAVPDKSAVADSIGKVFTVGSLLNISQTKAEKAMGLTKLYAAKIRNGPDGWMAKFKINYETLKLTELEMILNYAADIKQDDGAPSSSDEYAGIS